MSGGRHNPLRSEEEAFRWVVAIVGGCLAVIVLTALTEAVYGLVLLGVLVALGVGLVWRGSRGSERVAPTVASRDDGRHRILVIANQTVAGRALLDEIGNRARGRDAEILVVTPALTASQLKHWASDTDAAVEAAAERLRRSLATLAEAGLEAQGEVGDSEPNQAINDALLKFGANEVIISTLPPGKSHWLEKGVVERAREEVKLPVTHVVVDIDAEATPASGASSPRSTSG